MKSENGRGYKLRPQTTFIYNRSSPMNVGECRPDAVRTEMEGSDFLIEGTLEKDDDLYDRKGRRPLTWSGVLMLVTTTVGTRRVLH
jgi:hypothetical protein